MPENSNSTFNAASSQNFSGAQLSKSHDHGEGGHHQHHAHGHKPAAGGLQRHHLLMLVGVGLMLLAMIAYVMSMDEAIQPGGGVQEEVPAAAS